MTPRVQLWVQAVKEWAAFISDYITKNRRVPNPMPPIPVLPVEPHIPTLEEIKKTHDTSYWGGTLKERQEMWDLAKTICKEEGLGIKATSELLGTVYGESHWNRWAININKDGSGDYGITQMNTNYHLKEFKMTPVDALLNPAKCLRLMARIFRDTPTRKKNWYAFQAYLKAAPEEQLKRQARPSK